MRKTLSLLITTMLLAVFAVANAQTQWYGYALGSFGGESWQHKFISFETQAPGSVQTISETLPDIQAATYVDGYVWFVTSTSDRFNGQLRYEGLKPGLYFAIVGGRTMKFVNE